MALRHPLLLALLLAWPLVDVAAHTPHDFVKRIELSPDFDTDGVAFGVFQLSEHVVFARSSDGGRSWQGYGHSMMKFDVQRIRFSPDFGADGTAFVATARGGVYRTTDDGAGWTAVNNGLGSLFVRDITVSPSFATDDTVIAATSTGCYRSTDRGDSWTAANTGLTETNLRQVTFAPADAPTSTVFTGARIIHRSTDGGLTWTALDDLGATLLAIAPSPTFLSDDTVAVAVANGGGVEISTDGGASFAPSITGLTDLFPNDLVFTTDGTLFVSTMTDGCFRADGPFQTWTNNITGIEAPVLTQTNSHYRDVRASPDFANDGIVFLGTFQGLYRFDDAAGRWRQRDIYPQQVNRDFVVSPSYGSDGTIVLANFGGGVYISRDEGATWEPSSGVLTGGDVDLAPGGGPAGQPSSSPGRAAAGSSSADTDVEGRPAPPLLPPAGWSARADGVGSLFHGPIDISPDYGNDGTLFVGHAGLWRSTNRGQRWRKLTTAPQIDVIRGIRISPHYATDSTVFFGTTEEGVWKSTDRGNTWQLSDTGLPSDLKTRDFAYSPDFPSDQTMFLASRHQGVYRSTDGGDNWTDVNNGVTEPLLRVIAISPDYPQDTTVMIGSAGDGVFVTTDGGTSWVPRNTGIPDFGAIDVEGIAISPDFANDQTVVIATQRNGLFKSIDGANTWQPINDGLPLDMPRFVRMSPDFAEDETLFVSTHGWMYRSRDAGTSWTRLPGFTRVPDTHPLVFYEPTWIKQTYPDSHGDGVTSSVTPGAAFEYEFRGDSITFYATKDVISGIAEIELDGQVVELLDLYSPVPLYQQAVWSRTFDEVDWHTLRVTATGNAHPASLGDSIHSDGFSFTF